MLDIAMGLIWIAGEAGAGGVKYLDIETKTGHDREGTWMDSSGWQLWNQFGCRFLGIGAPVHEMQSLMFHRIILQFFWLSSLNF